MSRTGLRIDHHPVTLPRPAEHSLGRAVAEIGRIRRSRRALPVALAGLLVFMACQQPTAAPAGLSAGQRLPGLAPPVDDRSQRTPAQKKISSQLLMAMAERADAPGGALRGAGVDVDPEGRVLVDIDATVTDELLDSIVMMKGIVVNSFPGYDAVRARVPLDQLESLAEREDVRFIRQADIATTNSPGGVLQGR
ncbi:MAG: hypothetical protein O2930_01425 [Acidobacteria bacterium]|nr:hypothetical protein [Acidobacteriota bacterium]